MIKNDRDLNTRLLIVGSPHRRRSWSCVWFGTGMLRRTVLSLFLGLSIAVVTGCRESASDTPKSDTPTILPVQTLRSTTQPRFSYPLTFYGRIQYVRRSSLSFEFPGQVLSLLIDEGDRIGVGQPMARLDTSILDAEKQRVIASKKVAQMILRRLRNGEREEVVEAARARVKSIEAKTKRATLGRDRIGTLRDQNATSLAEYEEALYGSQSIQATLEGAKARLKELEMGTRMEDVQAQVSRVVELGAQIALLDVRIEKAILLAPFTAHVLKRVVDEGAVIRGGEPVFVVAEAGRHEARFSLPMRQLDEGKRSVTIKLGDDVVCVENVRVISTVSPETRTVDVVFELKDCGSLIAGQTCMLTLTETVNAKCVELPVSALAPSVRGLWSCYRVEKDEHSNAFRVVREELTINHTDGDRVFAQTSLPDGALVVRDGVHKLVPGMLVRLTEGKP